VSILTSLQTVTFYAKEDQEHKHLNEELRKKRERKHLKEVDESGTDLNINSKAILTWETYVMMYLHRPDNFACSRRFLDMLFPASLLL